MCSLKNKICGYKMQLCSNWFSYVIKFLTSGIMNWGYMKVMFKLQTLWAFSLIGSKKKYLGSNSSRIKSNGTGLDSCVLSLWTKSITIDRYSSKECTS